MELLLLSCRYAGERLAQLASRFEKPGLAGTLRDVQDLPISRWVNPSMSWSTTGIRNLSGSRSSSLATGREGADRRTRPGRPRSTPPPDPAPGPAAACGAGTPSAPATSPPSAARSRRPTRRDTAPTGRTPSRTCPACTPEPARLHPPCGRSAGTPEGRVGRRGGEPPTGPRRAHRRSDPYRPRHRPLRPHGLRLRLQRYDDGRKGRVG